MSYSVLNKIKRSSLSSLEKCYKKNIAKFLSSKREAVLTLINKYIQKFQRTLTSKEIMS